MERQVIRSLRKGPAQWCEEDCLTICSLLVKAGYTVRICRRVAPGQKAKTNAQNEYIIEYWEEE